MDKTKRVILELGMAVAVITALISKYGYDCIQRQRYCGERSSIMIRERYSLERIKSENQRISKESEEYFDRQHNELLIGVCCQVLVTTVNLGLYGLKALQENRGQARNEASQDRLDNKKLEEAEEARVEETGVIGARVEETGVRKRTGARVEREGR